VRKLTVKSIKSIGTSAIKKKILRVDVRESFGFGELVSEFGGRIVGRMLADRISVDGGYFAHDGLRLFELIILFLYTIQSIFLFITRFHSS
jgi:hypothetical protein